jgi:hypothetical protein
MIVSKDDISVSLQHLAQAIADFFGARNLLLASAGVPHL